MLLQKKSQTPLLLVTLLALTALSAGCAAKHLLSPPAPVMGIDIVELTNGQSAPFNGIEFSPRYLTDYLQWKCKEMGTC